jgi:hypothetical protein
VATSSIRPLIGLWFPLVSFGGGPIDTQLDVFGTTFRLSLPGPGPTCEKFA